MKTKSRQIEVLPSASQARSEVTQLDALVKQRVAEILAQREELIFEPFFRSRQVAYELRRLQNMAERSKWAVFYERHGCQRCGKSEQPHQSNGYCPRCYAWIFSSLKRIIRELGEEGV